MHLDPPLEFIILTPDGTVKAYLSGVQKHPSLGRIHLDMRIECHEDFPVTSQTEAMIFNAIKPGLVKLGICCEGSEWAGSCPPATGENAAHTQN